MTDVWVRSDLNRLVEKHSYFEYVETVGSTTPTMSKGCRFAHEGWVYEVVDVDARPVDDGRTPYVVALLANRIGNDQA